MQRVIRYILVFFAAIFAATALAVTVNIYEKADESSKVIAVMKTGDQLMPIFYTEKKDWVKVANPKNGDVGWAKTSELKGPVVIVNVNGAVTQQQVIGDDNKNPQVYSVVQYSGPKGLTPEEAQELAKKMQKQQQDMEVSMQQMQKHMQQMMQDMFKDIDNSFSPMFQQDVVVPDNNKQAVVRKKQSDKKNN